VKSFLHTATNNLKSLGLDEKLKLNPHEAEPNSRQGYENRTHCTCKEFTLNPHIW